MPLNASSETANPDQGHRERAEFAIEPKRTLYVHDAPNQPTEPPFPDRSSVSALLVALAGEMVQIECDYPGPSSRTFTGHQRPSRSNEDRACGAPSN
jgi:hypothetical protein